MPTPIGPTSPVNLPTLHRADGVGEYDVNYWLSHPADALDEIDRIECEESLYAFVKRMWHVLEPANPMVPGWCMEAICEHLQAVTEGHIQKLAINVPPGFSKSLITNVFWPAWEWGPRRISHLRYLSFSYTSILTERDNRRFRDIILNHDYSRLFGGNFSILKAGEQLVSNDKTGWKLATSVGGVGTGERGDRVVCLPADECILTDVGPLPIAHVVENHLPVRVAGLDHATGGVVWQNIAKYEINPGSDLVEIEWAGGSLRCTPEHPVFVPGRGYTRADSVRVGESIYAVPALWEGVSPQAEPPAEILLTGVQGCLPQGEIARGEQSPVRAVWNDDLSPPGTLGEGRECAILQPQMPRGVEPRPEQSSIYRLDAGELQGVRSSFHAPAYQDSNVLQKVWPSPLSGKEGDEGAQGEPYMRGVRLGVYCANEIDAILHAPLRGLGPCQADIGGGERQVRSRRGRQAIPSGLVQSLQGDDPSEGRGPMHDVRSKSGGGPKPRRAPHRLREGELASGQPDHAMSLVPREAAWPPAVTLAVVTNVKRIAGVDRTYNVNVTPCHNYFAGRADGVLVHNCDDLNNVKDSESDTIRDETNRWIREGMANRLNDAAKSAIVSIQQRTHELDATGTILANFPDFHHLLIPMEYEGRKTISTVPDLVFNEDPRDEIGALAWPKRFNAVVCRNLKTTVGPFAWAGQYLQQPTPRGGGIFKRDWWRLWDPPPVLIQRADGSEDYVQKFPQCSFIVASLDGAFGQKQENDWTALTVWGVFTQAPGVLASTTRQQKHYLEQYMRDTGGVGAGSMLPAAQSMAPNVILMQAWRKRLPLNGLEVEQWEGESDGDFRLRQRREWGIVQWVIDTCRRLGVNILLVEAKANGIDVANEVRRQMEGQRFGVQLIDPGRLDKVARAYAVQHIFADGMVYAPVDEAGGDNFRQWADDVIVEMANFPRSAHDDLCDTASQAIKWLRDNGLLQHAHEMDRVLVDELRNNSRGPVLPLYPA